MPYTEKRLEEYCKKFGLCKEKGTCQCKEELKFIAESITQAIAEERDRVRGVIEKPLGIVADFVERWNKQDKEKDVAQAIEELLSIKKLNI